MMGITPLNIFKALLLSCLLVPVACQFPGPNVVQSGASGGNFPATEVWIAQRFANGPVAAYPVRDLDQPIIPMGNGQFNKPLRPTLVYNCHFMMSLCANVRDYVGRKSWTLPVQLHYDKDQRVKAGNRWKGARSIERRKNSCPASWIDTQVGGRNRCPPPPANRYQYFTNMIQTPQDIEMFKEQDALGQWVDSKNYLGKQSKKRDSNGNQITVYHKNGIMLTCDEWPAASWIEGGGTGANAASTICAPQNAACGKGPNGGSSEQDWQAYGHQTLGSWMQRNTPAGQRQRSNIDWTIYKFNFDLTTDASPNAPAVWVEAAGVKRYCNGPKGKAFYGCKP